LKKRRGFNGISRSKINSCSAIPRENVYIRKRKGLPEEKIQSKGGKGETERQGGVLEKISLARHKPLKNSHLRRKGKRDRRVRTGEEIDGVTPGGMGNLESLHVNKTYRKDSIEM